AAYRDMLRNPYVKSAAFSKCLQVASLEFQAQPSKWSGPAGKGHADALQFTLENVDGGTAELAWNLLIGQIQAGYVLGEKVYDVRRGGRWDGLVVLRAVKDKDPHTYLPYVDQFLNLTAVSGMLYGMG